MQAALSSWADKEASRARCDQCICSFFLTSLSKVQKAKGVRFGTLVWREQPRLVFLKQWGDPVEDSTLSSKINLKILKRGQINTSLNCLLTAHLLHNDTQCSLGWLLNMSAPMEVFSSFSNFINWQVAQQWPRRKFPPLREWPASGRLPNGDRGRGPFTFP